MTYSRVQFKPGTTAAATSLAITMDSAPTAGNKLEMIVGTPSGSASRVSSISQTNVLWARKNQSTNATGAQVEQWEGAVSSSASASLTINLAASLVCAAVVAEYTGAPSGHALDKTATDNNTGGGSYDTGTTATTTFAGELWVGGGAITGSSGIGAPNNSFTQVAKPNVGTFIVSYCERIVIATGAATTTQNFTTPTDSEIWAGLMSTYGGTSGSVVAGQLSSLDCGA